MPFEKPEHLYLHIVADIFSTRVKLKGEQYLCYIPVIGALKPFLDRN